MANVLGPTLSTEEAGTAPPEGWSWDGSYAKSALGRVHLAQLAFCCVAFLSALIGKTAGFYVREIQLEPLIWTLALSLLINGSLFFFFLLHLDSSIKCLRSRALLINNVDKFGPMILGFLQLYSMFLVSPLKVAHVNATMFVALISSLCHLLPKSGWVDLFVGKSEKPSEDESSLMDDAYEIFPHTES